MVKIENLLFKRKEEERATLSKEIAEILQTVILGQPSAPERCGDQQRIHPYTQYLNLATLLLIEIFFRMTGEGVLSVPIALVTN